MANFLEMLKDHTGRRPDAIEPTAVNDHDFPSAGNGKVIPHGIYDVGRNEAALPLNTSHDTAEFACESIELWWSEQGQCHYPKAGELLILCDGGGVTVHPTISSRKGYRLCRTA